MDIEIKEKKKRKRKKKYRSVSVPNGPNNPANVNLNDTLSNGIFEETGMVSDGYDTQSPTSVDSQNEKDPITKKIRPASADAELIIEDPLALHVHIISSNDDNSELKKLDPWDITESLQEVIGTFISCKTLESGTILVECECNAQVKILINDLKDFRGISVIAKIAFNIGTVRGVIRDARLTDISIETLLQRLQSQGVVHVRPIYGGHDKHRTDYSILTFRLAELPEKILFGRESKVVTPYRNKVIQCTHCWHFGHRSERCKKQKACENCATKGTEHNSESCQDQTPKCTLCFKEHKATNKQCPIYKKQKDIAKLRDEHKVGFRKAEEIYIKQNASKAKNYARNNQRATPHLNPQQRANSTIHNSQQPSTSLPSSNIPLRSSYDNHQSNMSYVGALISPQRNQNNNPRNRISKPRKQRTKPPHQLSSSDSEMEPQDLSQKTRLIYRTMNTQHPARHHQRLSC